MEEDAYLRGNMCFRDWEDGYKQSNPLLERKERLYYELLEETKVYCQKDNIFIHQL